MDDIFGEIIYIVVMLAIFIFSALKKKKAAGSDMPEREVENPMDEVFSPFKEIFEDEELESPRRETVPPSKPKAETRETLKDAPFVKEDYVFTSNTAPGDARRQRKNKTPGRQTVLKSDYDLPATDETAPQHPLEWFDLRKAVIYSEILKRPDY